MNLNFTILLIANSHNFNSAYYQIFLESSMITAENQKLIFANTVFNYVNLAILGQVAKMIIFSSYWVLKLRAIY